MRKTEKEKRRGDNKVTLYKVTNFKKDVVDSEIKRVIRKVDKKYNLSKIVTLNYK